MYLHADCACWFLAKGEKNKKLKKGFTIVELVIVIAVIAILASVLIPVFSNVVEKANLSVDQQAVRQMNTAIATYGDIENIADLKALLAEDNIDANNYKPLTKGTEFFWTGKKIVMVKGNEVIYPEEAKGTANKDAWFSLSGSGNQTAVNELKDSGALEANAVVNMQGASINLKPENGYVLGSSSASAPAQIQNVVSDEGSKIASNTGEFADNSYYAGLINTVAKETKVTVQNLVIDGAVIGDTLQKDSARAGIIAGHVDGELVIENVTIKNSTVFAEYRVGALIGSVGADAKITIKNVTFENVTVKGVTITAALIGDVNKAATVEVINTTTDGITVTLSDFNNYEGVIASQCAPNTNGDLFTNQGFPYLSTNAWWVLDGSQWSDYKTIALS